MKKIDKKTVFWIAFYTVMAVIFAFCIYCLAVVIPAKKNTDKQPAYDEQMKQPELQVTLTPTEVPGTEITEAPVLEPTVEPTDSTKEPDVTEVPENITSTPEATKTPAKEPEVTETPTTTERPSTEPTETPAVTNTPVPTATSTPAPSSTPTPTPNPVVKLKASVKMGDDVNYLFYEEGILIVTGTGTTWDFEHTSTLANYFRDECNEEGLDYAGKLYTYEKVTSIIVSEGVNGLGNFAMSLFRTAESVTLPQSLNYIGESTFKSLGSLSSTGTVEWIGLEMNRLAVEPTSFYLAKGLEHVDNIEDYQVKPSPTPTPLPPTPTPTPNPEQPKIRKTQQMGDDVTYELWDNGILYIKGSGTTWDIGYADLIITSAKKVVIEEGITYLGSCSLFLDFNELVLPSTLKKVDSVGLGLGSVKPGAVITGYKDGKKLTITATEKDAASNGVVYLDDFLFEYYDIPSFHRQP